MHSQVDFFLSFLAPSYILMSSYFRFFLLFKPIRMTFLPRSWPARTCPWKSCALWRVRARVQRSSHPQKSSTESMTWVWLPDLHLSAHKFQPFSPKGHAWQMVECKWGLQLYSHGNETAALTLWRNVCINHKRGNVQKPVWLYCADCNAQSRCSSCSINLSSSPNLPLCCLQTWSLVTSLTLS